MQEHHVVGNNSWKPSLSYPVVNTNYAPQDQLIGLLLNYPNQGFH